MDNSNEIISNDEITVEQVEKKLDETEQIEDNEIQFELWYKNAKPLEKSKMDKELDKKILKNPEEQKQIEMKIKTLIKENIENVKQIEKNFIIKKDDLNEDFLSFFNLSLPIDSNMNISFYINNWTKQFYDPFGEEKGFLLKKIDERLVFITKLGKIFSHDFITKIDSKYKFNDLGLNICKFIGKTKFNKTTTKISYTILKSILGKLLISMHSNVDKAFKCDNVTVDYLFYNALKPLIREMKWIEKDNIKLSNSWYLFLNSFLNINDNKQIYKFNNSEELFDKMKECYNNDFELELLLGNSLKCFVPSIALNYLYAIRDAYLISYLLSIYVNNKLFMIKNKRKSDEEIINDLYIISNVISIEYESMYLSIALIARSFPLLKDGELSEKTNMYYSQHGICGPQFLIIKQLEKTFPLLYNYIQ